MPTELTWRALTPDDLAETAALAARCLAADGGLPLAATEGFLAGRFTGDGVRARGAADPAGRLVAAGAARARENADGTPGAAFLGLVDPAYRGRGIGSELVDWGLTAAAGIADRVAVETESLTDAARALFAARGLRQTFAEDVQRFDLGTEPPAIALPAGVSLTPWSPERAERFFEVYRAAFRHRPGFPGWSARRWIGWTADDEEFRPGWSLLATDASAGDVGFVTCAEGWIVQVGVRPDQRGRRLGAALVAEALRRMRDENRQYVLLTVNVDNSAGELYRRLGFRTIGRRARFEVSTEARQSSEASAEE